MNCSPFTTPHQLQIHLRAVSMVQDERLRHVKEKGYTCAHDDQHSLEELAAAAAFFLMPATSNGDVCVSTQDDEAPLRLVALLNLLAEHAWADIERHSDLELDYENDPAALDLRIDVVTVGASLALAELERLLRLRDSRILQGL